MQYACRQYETESLRLQEHKPDNKQENHIYCFMCQI